MSVENKKARRARVVVCLALGLVLAIGGARPASELPESAPTAAVRPGHTAEPTAKDLEALFRLADRPAEREHFQPLRPQAQSTACHVNGR